MSEVRIESARRQQPQINAPEDSQNHESTSFISLFRFATKLDVLFIIIGSIGAIIVGLSIPVLGILEGNIATTDQFGQKLEDKAKQLMLNFLYIGLGAFVAYWIGGACWLIAAERQSLACRKEYFKSLLRQEIGWFDTINQSELSIQFASDCNAFKGAIGEKLLATVVILSMFMTTFIISSIYGWLLALVMLSSIPLIILGGYIFAGALNRQDSEHEKAYKQAGGLVEQAVSNIKTIKQLNGQQFQTGLYSKTLKGVSKSSIVNGVMIGLGYGILHFSLIASYSLGFWFGSHCVEGTGVCPSKFNGSQTYSAGDVLIIFFTFLQTGFYYNQLPPAIKKLTEGRQAATRIFKIIDRKPLIESPQNPLIPEQFKGVIRFEDITFSYPKDKSTKILSHLDLEIDVRSSAFVGDSGCGKSTILQLLMRFYDPDQGRITLDGNDLRALDLDWLRRQIGYVGQEPVLFATTIKENLLLGKEDASDDQIIEVLVKAEAFDFVYQLKDNLNTYVGTGGGQISGGQKQRLAIARALLKNPKILIFDEATSALDRKNQKLIQSTLNKISEDKIVINIAHRVRTICQCERVFVLGKRKLIEQGSFEQLQRFQGVIINEDQQQLEDIEIKIKNKKKGLSLVDVDKKQNENENKNISEDELKLIEEKQLLQRYEGNIFGRLFGYVSDKKCLFAIGIIMSILNGFIYPFFTIFFASMLAVLMNFSNDPAQARSDSNFNALIIFLLAIATLIFSVILRIIFYDIGQTLTERIRRETYLKILKMPVPWFQRPNNSSGVISDRLSSDCRSINSLVSTFISFMVQNVTVLASGIAISFIYEWRTALVAVGLLPLIILNGFMEMAQEQGLSQKTKKLYQQSSIFITQSMNNIRTITSLGCTANIERKYATHLQKPQKIAIKKSIITGLLLGLSELILFFFFGVIFYLGIVFMVRNNLESDRVFTAIYAIIFSGLSIGNNIQMTPDVTAGKTAAAGIFAVLDSADEDALQIISGSKMLKTPIRGHFQFKDVSFKYESREDTVLDNFNLQIKKGSKVAFVGPSGCGKSTILQLIQRFYDSQSGLVLIDGQEIKDYDIHHLRNSLGVVSQEPALFNNTIGWNIKYNRSETTHEEIVAAANQSNFNPETQNIQYQEQEILIRGENLGQEQERRYGLIGFDKNVGVRGSHISGGQKQRVAIARTILRKPDVLLFDEATSALDSINQKKVQESIDRLLMGVRTSITIAHRFQTISNSDDILMFQQGKIIERGTFKDLMKREGHFYKLQRGAF